MMPRSGIRDPRSRSLASGLGRTVILVPLDRGEYSRCQWAPDIAAKLAESVIATDDRAKTRWSRG